MKAKLYAHIARLIKAIENCKQSGNDEWYAKHDERLSLLIANHMPSGSGIDSGTELDPKSTPERLVFNTSFHHMDEGGMYDGWTDHQVIVTASLMFGIDVRITGRNRNDIKEYLGGLFAAALEEEVEA